MGRINEALDYREVYGLESSWARIEAMYANLPGSTANEGPNIIQEMAEALEARLGVRNPKVCVYPSALRPDSVETAPIIEAVDRYLMRTLNVSTHVADCILHAYLWGRGIMKIGYDSEWGYDEALDISPDDKIGMTLSQFSRGGKRIEYGNARPGFPWIAPVLPHDFLVPWGTWHLETAPWVAHRIIRHIDLLRADSKYEKTQRLQPNMSMRDVVDSYKKTSLKYRKGAQDPYRKKSSNVEFVELWEIRSRIDGKIITISETEVHRNQVDLLQFNSFPFISLSLLRAPRTFWFTPQAQYLQIHQADQYDIAKQASNQRRINTIKFLVQEGAMEISELEKALSPNVGIAAFTKPGFNPKEVMALVPQTSNLSLYQDAAFSERAARRAIGFSPNQLGEFDTSGRRTATEAGIVNQGANARTDLRQDRVAEFYQNIFIHLNKIIGSFWKTPRVIKIGEGQWPKFTGPQLQNEYDYEIMFGEDQPRDPMSRMQFAMQMYSQLSQDPFINQSSLRSWFSRAFSDVEFSQLLKESANAAVQLPLSGMQGGGNPLLPGQ